MATEARRSTLALVVLALLVTEPMHPYEMQVRIREWAKDQVINVKQRSSLYRTIERLLAAGLVEVQATERERFRPERTVYAITDAGRAAARTWQLDMLATPAQEYPEFPAALSLVAVLDHADVLAALEQRLAKLDAAVADLHRDTQEAGVLGVPRLFLIEGEYLLAVTTAERTWVSAIVDDLRNGRLIWDEAWVRAIADQLSEGGPPAAET
jgi:DNA-binding PadR family transcriptional regulator